jgi:hypothetical protein
MYQEKKLISDAINAAMVDIITDYSVTRWQFNTSDYTVATTANTSYVDLTAAVFKVVTGTPRIEADDVTLQLVSLEQIRQMDPGDDQTGRPDYYAIDSSGTAGTIRLELWPIPDAAYTIDYTAEIIMDEDSTTTFPNWLHAALKDKSTENALRDLGLFGEALQFKLSYEERLKHAKGSQGHDAPIAVPRRRIIYRSNIQSRLP